MADSTLSNLNAISLPLDAGDELYVVRNAVSYRINVGDITLDKSQVGLDQVPDVDATNASNLATGTVPYARLPVGQITNTVAAGDDNRIGNASALSTGTIPYARLPVSQTANNVAAGDDPRFTNARTPTGAAGGILAGTYPNPSFDASAKGAIGLGDVTNAAQALASVYPNTLPATAKIPISSGNAYAPQTVSGDGTLSAAGALVVTKTNGTNFAPSATTDTTNAGNLSTGSIPLGRISTNVKTRGIGWTASNGSSALANGAQIPITTDFGGVISGWSIATAGTTPTCTIDVWKKAAGSNAIPNVADTIMGTKPALTTGNAIRSTTLTNWATTVNAGDIFIANLDAVTNATQLSFVIEVVPTT